MKKILAALTLTGLIVLAGCGPQTTPTTTTTATTTPTTPAATTTNPSEMHAALVEGNTDFAFDLYRQLKDEEGNLFLSPYSLSSALAMAYAGARGTTESQMAEALSFNLAQTDLHSAFGWLREELASRPANPNAEEPEALFRLHIVNDIWGQEDYPYLAQYLETLEQYYGAGLRELDFVQHPEESRLTINDYISDQTEDRINDLIPQGAITPMTALVLTNAIYFNANWLFDFPENNTAPADFHLLDGGTGTVDMMLQSNTFGYYDGDGYQALEMVYRGMNTSMIVLLPDEGGFTDFESSLDTALLADALENLRSEQVVLRFPRFSFESNYSMNEPLKALGMTDAFGNADFSGITTGDSLFISDVFHKTFIAVDEKGTEAAAASAVIMAKGAALEPAEMTVDRPFIFLIRDIPTGTVLFLGRVLAP